MGSTPSPKAPRPRRHARDAVAAQLAAWELDGHDVGPGERAALEQAAYGVDLQAATARSGVHAGRSLTLAAANLAALIRAAAPGGDADDLATELAAYLDA